MKIKINTTEIECTANELKQSNSLSEGLYNMLRGVFNGMGSDSEDDADIVDEEDTDDE